MKRFKQKGKNRKLFVATAAVLAAAAVCGGTIFVFAVSRNTYVADNSALVATSGVRIVESSDPGFGRKEVSFLNDQSTNSPVLLRIAYSETWTDSNDQIVSNIGSNSANVVTKTWTNAFAQDFVSGNDGWYYYKKTLEPLQSVQVLSSISLNDSSYNIYNYDIAFRFEAVQADATAASELWGKTATVANGVVTWTF